MLLQAPPQASHVSIIPVIGTRVTFSRRWLLPPPTLSRRENTRFLWFWLRWPRLPDCSDSLVWDSVYLDFSELAFSWPGPEFSVNLEKPWSTLNCPYPGPFYILGNKDLEPWRLKYTTSTILLTPVWIRHIPKGKPQEDSPARYNGKPGP